MTQEWKKLNDYPNYSISNMGQIKNDKTGRFLKPSMKGNYIGANLWNEDKKPNSIAIHRLVALAFIPNENNYNQIDHINRDKLDNRVENLRWCNNGLNQTNKLKRPNTSSKYKGVSYNKRDELWYCSIQIKNERKHLGYFKNENEAGLAYNQYILDHNLQEFYILNTI